MTTRETVRARHRDSYPLEQLELVGFLGALGSRATPFVIAPLLAVRDHDHVIVPSYRFEGMEEVLVETAMSRDDLRRMVDAGEATELPVEPARRDACLYVPAGDGAPQYMTVSEARVRLMRIASLHRRVGDRRFRAGDKQGALRHYTLAAQVAQSPDDYARMLLSDPTDTHVAVARPALAELGYNVTRLCQKIKEEIEKGR